MSGGTPGSPGDGDPRATAPEARGPNAVTQRPAANRSDRRRSWPADAGGSRPPRGPVAGRGQSASGPKDRRTDRHLGRLWFGVVAALGLILICAVPLWHIYRHPFLLVTVLGAVVLGTALALVGHRLRLPWVAIGVAALAVGVLIGPVLTIPSETIWSVIPTAAGIADFSVALVTGWSDIVSVELPLGTYDVVLVPAFVVVFIAVLVAVSQVLRGRRWPVFVASGTVLAFGIAFGGAQPTVPITVGVFAVVWVLSWTLLDQPRSVGIDQEHAKRLRRGRRIQTVSAFASVLVCAVLGATLAQATDSDRRVVVRDAFAPEYRPELSDSPLQSFRSSVTGATADSAIATVDGLEPGAMLRLSVMDEYTGVAFRIGDQRRSASTGSFSRVPFVIDRADADGALRTTNIEIYADLGILLPIPAEPVGVDVADRERDALYYNRELDSAVLTDGVSAGTEYAVTALDSGPARRGGLGELAPGGTVQPDLVQRPEQLLDAVARRFDPEQTPGARLQSALEYLHAGYVSHADEGEPFSRSGHSLQRLDLLASDEPMLGDAEQYAAAFAVIARDIGFPSRVVLGYVDADENGELLGSELTAWVEVDTAEQGWVAVDPNPERRDIPEEQRTTEDAIAPPRTVIPPEPPTQQDALSPQTDESESDEREETPRWHAILAAVWWWTWRILLSVAVLTAPLWAIVVAGTFRRARRRRRDRRDLTVVGVWDEARDALIDQGVDPEPSETRHEFATRSGADQMVALARRTDAAVFGPSDITRATVDEVWRSLPEVVAETAQGQSRWQRFLTAISLRSMLAGRWRTLSRSPDHSENSEHPAQGVQP